MKGIMNIQDIMKILPHRYPFLLVDRVIEKDDNKIKAIKNVTMNEQFFQGHFPGAPVMPGVLQIEGMAQAAGILLSNLVENHDDYIIYFMTIDKVKFRAPVVPGDVLEYNMEIVKTRGLMGVVKGTVSVDGSVVCQAEMKATFQKR